MKIIPKVAGDLRFDCWQHLYGSRHGTGSCLGGDRAANASPSEMSRFGQLQTEAESVRPRLDFLYDRTAQFRCDGCSSSEHRAGCVIAVRWKRFLSDRDGADRHDPDTLESVDPTSSSVERNPRWAGFTDLVNIYESFRISRVFDALGRWPHTVLCSREHAALWLQLKISIANHGIKSGGDCRPLRFLGGHDTRTMPILSP